MPINFALEVTEMLSLYVYVDGADLESIETDLLYRFTQFVKEWGVSTASVVNDKHPRTPNLNDEDLPDWNLGLNFTAKRLPREKILDLVRFLSVSAKHTGREFVIGSQGEDWCFVGQEPRGNVVEFLAEQLT